DAPERFDQRARHEIESVGQPQGVCYVVRRDAEVFGHAARLERASPPGRALHVVAARAVDARHAGCVMVREHAVSEHEGSAFGIAWHGIADRRNDTGGFVSEDERRLAPDVPGHEVARAYAARRRAHEQIAATQLRNRAVFDADVVDVVENGGALQGTIAYLMPSPPSSCANASASSSSA